MKIQSFNSRFNKSRKILRSIAAALVLSLLLQDALFAAGSSPSQPVRIPQELGEIRGEKTFPSGKLIINIQDAHAQLGAQESISNILDDLVKRYDLSLISLEGASDHVDTSLVSAFPDADVRHKTARSLLRNGQISAGEFYSMVSEKRVQLYGAEDKTLYEENLEAFREIAEKRPAVRAQLKKLRGVVASLENVFYPEDLKDFLSAKRRFRHSLKGFSEYWKQCRGLADKFAVRYEEYPNLVKLDQVLDFENRIDFKKASGERELLMEELTRLLPKRSVDELLLLALEYKKGKISDVRFHRSLLGMTRELSLSLRDYPNLDLYTGYLERYELIDFAGLLGELGSFESALRRRLETTPYSQRLSMLSERARLVTALLDVSLENTDYEKYLSLNGPKPLEILREDLEELCRVSGKRSFALVDYRVLEDSLPWALRFYEYATKRNQALVANTLRRMEQERVQVAALITGGFHSDGLAKLLDSNKVSHLIVMPKFDDKAGERPYITVLTQKPKEHEAMFKDSGMYLAPPVLLDIASAKETLVRVLAAAYIKDGGLSARRKEEYIRAYEERVAGDATPVISPRSLERYLRTLHIEKDAEGLTFTLYGKGSFFPAFEVFRAPVAGGQVGKIKLTRTEGSLLSWPDLASWTLIGTAFALYWHLAPWMLVYYLLFKLVVFLDLVPAQENTFFCGNFGLIAVKMRGDKQLLPQRFRPLVRLMGKQTEIRGEQAGGGLMFGDKNGTTHLVGKKVVNIKRRNLTQALEKKLAGRLKRAEGKGFKPLDSLIMGIFHYRYNTNGSKSTVLETHYHEWTPAAKKNVWRFDGRKWARTSENVHHVITHNGDFDGWNLFGKEIDNLTLGSWLERVLHQKNGTRGDSPKIAGMMDLLITQGMWDSSLRLAYQWTVADSVEDTVPSPKELNEWTYMFENAFKSVLKKDPADLEEALIEELLSRQKPLPIPAERWGSFVRYAVAFFLRNDPNLAAKFFLSRAAGSFGLVVASSLNEEQLVVAAKGQPMTLGYNRKDRLAVYASEPAAVNSVLLSQNPESSYRLDLDSVTGEIALMGVDEVSIYSMKKNDELNDEDLRGRWIPMHNNPYIRDFPVDDSKDPVANDISSIPRVLSHIEKDWKDAGSFNRRSSGYFEDLLVEMAERHHTRPAGLVSKTADILITGIENSLWLGEQFAQDMGSAFPGLNVQSISANKIIDNPAELPVGPETVVLYISQSGQTFASLQGTALLESFNKTSDSLRKKGIKELFVMTGELDSLMGAAIGQKYQSDAPFERRIFVNGSGRRTAEPSTVAAAAAEQTLTELFLRLIRRLREEFPGHQEPLGLALTTNDLDSLEARKNEFVHSAVPYITGADARGLGISSPENDHFIRAGKKWADHITEGAFAWFFSALYVAGSLIASAFTHATPVVTVVTLITGGTPALPVLLALLLVDAAVYVWMPWFIVLAKRLLDSRPLFARRGKRTLVIGDVPHVHQPLEQYVSKLFSLSHGDASLDVHGANPQDHMLHRFGHRVVRGTLLWLGVPDGRRSGGLRRKSNAVLMTGKQAKGVANLGVSAEVTIVGSDPDIAQKGFDDTILLHSEDKAEGPRPDHPDLVEKLAESRFTSFQRLLGGYVHFWAMAKKTASLPLLRYEFWKSQSRTRIATTASPSGIAASELSAEYAPWSDPPHARQFTVVGRSEGARLAGAWIRTGLFVFTLIGWLFNPFSKAAAATVKGISGQVVTLNPENGDSLWRIARQMLGDDASNQEVADRVRELVSQNGIENPDLIYAQYNYTFDAGSSGDAVNAAQNMGFTPPAPAPVDIPVQAPPVDVPVDTSDAVSENVSAAAENAADLLTSIPGLDGILIATLAFVAVSAVIFLIWKNRAFISRQLSRFRFGIPGSRRSDRALLERSVSDEDGPPRVRSPRTTPAPIPSEPLRENGGSDPGVSAGASGPPPVRKTSGGGSIFSQPRFDDPAAAATGARLAVTSGGPPPLPVGVILPAGQSQNEFERTISMLIGEKTERFLFLYAAQATPAVFEAWKTAGVGLVLDEPVTDGPSGDLRLALLQLLGRLEEERFESLGALVQRLAGTDLRPLTDEERRLILESLPPVEKKNIGAGLAAAETVSSALEESVTGSGISLHTLRFALADPSYRIDLSSLAPAALLTGPRTIVTDLDVFAKDAGGVPYALRMQDLKKKAPGAFSQALLVRDPALKDRSDVVTKFPDAGLFAEHEMIFAPDALTMEDLRRMRPSLFAENTVVVMPEPGLLLPDTEKTDKKAILLSLDPQADSSIGILEAAALLVQNDAVVLTGLAKKQDGSWWYLPPIVPLGYRLLVEALTGARMTLRSA